MDNHEAVKYGDLEKNREKPLRWWSTKFIVEFLEAEGREGADERTLRRGEGTQPGTAADEDGTPSV